MFRSSKNVYDIETIPKPYTNKQRQKRNAIAHGRNSVEMKLAEFCDLEIFVTKSAQFVSEQCNRKHKLII